MEKILCIYHGKCADGFTAAWVVRRALGAENVEFYAADYKDKTIPDTSGRHVVMVDFSYKAGVLAKLAESAESLLILDHHKTAADDLGGLPPAPASFAEWSRYLADSPEGHHSVAAFFDMTRSGAGIAWDFFFPGERRPELVNYVEDRDIWKHTLPLTKEINSYIFSHRYEFEIWDDVYQSLELHTTKIRSADLGRAILNKFERDLDELLPQVTRWTTIRGYRVPIANLPYTFVSEAGHRLCRENPDAAFAAVYFDGANGRAISLRSVGEFDASEIAASYGGGGHRNACGFTMPVGWEGDGSDNLTLK